jgi:hypothetical protein
MDQAIRANRVPLALRLKVARHRERRGERRRTRPIPRGALERVALLLADWLQTHRRLGDTEPG